MSRFKSVFRPATIGLALGVVAGIAPGPESVTRRLDEALSASWRALGDRLAEREIDSIARQLDLGRQGVEQIEARRDALEARLLTLEAGRDRVEACVKDGGPPRGAGPELEPVSLNDAIHLLRPAVAHADRVLDRARRELREREGVLTVLRAAADARRMDRALAGPACDPSGWDVRVARARDFLGMTLPDGRARDGRPERPGPP